MGMSLGGGGGQKAEINVTPMIDVLLVLIIIFMVITPLPQTGLKALVPQTSTSDEKPSSPRHDIVITVEAGGTVRLNQEPVALHNLQERLARLFKNRPDDVIFVRGEKDIEFQQVAEVIDIARGAGIYRVALMTQ